MKGRRSSALPDSCDLLCVRVVCALAVEPQGVVVCWCQTAPLVVRRMRSAPVRHVSSDPPPVGLLGLVSVDLCGASLCTDSQQGPIHHRRIQPEFGTTPIDEK